MVALGGRVGLVAPAAVVATMYGTSVYTHLLAVVIQHILLINLDLLAAQEAADLLVVLLVASLLAVVAQD